MTFARHHLVIPLRAVSGAECVDVLVRQGFRVVRRPDDATVLQGFGRVVIVPDRRVLDLDVLELILSDARLSSGRFLELLDERHQGPKDIETGVHRRRRLSGTGRLPGTG